PDDVGLDNHIIAGHWAPIAISPAGPQRLIADSGQIAHRLGIAEGTVKRYTHHLFGKLGVQNRAEAVYESTRQNLL
ncbi:MAG: helix-turn-helix transcriptional regulator, partial [Pseudonocardia sp.]|nr:helix-turn-helix transcriptional regulator [Pseudonocardia sp.]